MNSRNGDGKCCSDTLSLESQLDRAVMMNDVESAEKLLRAGANVNAVDLGGFNPLQLAIINQRSELVALLRRYGGTLLGVRTVFDDVVEENLRQVQAAVTNEPLLTRTMDSQGWTLLHWAVRVGVTELANWLLDNGADVSARARDGDTPLGFAAEAKNPEMAELLVNRGAELEATGPGMAPLHRAAYNGAEQVARVLLAQGANADAGIGKRWTPLHCAAANGHTHVVRMLLDAGANGNATDSSGTTPLHCAAVWGQLDVVELLLARGADITLRDSGGETALDGAVKRGHPHICRLLSTYAEPGKTK